jgi:integrase
LRITARQFRHAADARILEVRPAEYDLVRQILGHRSVQTTISSNVGWAHEYRQMLVDARNRVQKVVAADKSEEEKEVEAARRMADYDA